MTFKEALIIIKAGYKVHRVKWTTHKGRKNDHRWISLRPEDKTEIPGIVIWTYEYHHIIPWVPRKADITADDWQLYEGKVLEEIPIVIKENWQIKQFKRLISQYNLTIN
jgi:hypothetical protein